MPTSANAESSLLLPPSPADWRPVCSGQQALSLALSRVGGRPVLRLDYDFKGAGGFVVARCEWRQRLPARYALRFRLRGQGAVNDLELKLVDASGHSVWRKQLKGLRPSARGRRYQIAGHEFDFGWGPAGGGGLGELGAFELAVVAGEGGAGRLWLSELELVDAGPPPSWRAEASSEECGHGAAQALHAAGWRPLPLDDQAWLRLDAGAPCALGGLGIEWTPAAPASGYRLLASNNGQRWRSLHRARAAGGASSWLHLPGLKTRYLRLEIAAPGTGARLLPQPPEFARSIEDYWQRRAALAPRGHFPRWLLGEQSLWTPAGSGEGQPCALINEEGLVELSPGSCTVEPMLWLHGRLHSWAEVECRQSLEDGWQPIPTVCWQGEGWRLSLRLAAEDRGRLRLRYRLENLGDEELPARLFLLLRPFQVTPPWQRHGALGGISPIRQLHWRAGTVWVNGEPRLRPLRQPDGFGALGFDQGLITEALAAGELPPARRVRDAEGYASGALRFDLRVSARGQSEVEVLGLSPASQPVSERAAIAWASALSQPEWSAPGWGAEAIAVARTATAHILLCRDGPALQAGPRRYTRSWIRDGAVMSAALLRMGWGAAVDKFIHWYAPYQRADGFVPCCVDRDGPDWLVEHDSHGQWLALIADRQRHGGDAAQLEQLWPSVRRTVDCIAGLLDDSGLLPISASHEGYLAQPVHAYWDDFWALRGLGDAAYLAEQRGEPALARQWQALRTRFSHSLYGSLARTRAERGLDSLPASLELADFDPTATANAVQLLGGAGELEAAPLRRTFDRHLDGWRRQRRGAEDWANYSPYQIRIISALVRLGRRADALELLRDFLAERRPRAWNQWPEISWRDPRAPAHIGDVPHAWIAAEYVLALRSLYVHEQPDDRGLVLAAGLAPEWLVGVGVALRAAPTVCGALSYRLRRLDARQLEFEIEAGGNGRLELRPPLPGAIRAVTVDGRAWHEHDQAAVRFTSLPGPARVRIETGD